MFRMDSRNLSNILPCCHSCQGACVNAPPAPPRRRFVACKRIVKSTRNSKQTGNNLWREKRERLQKSPVGSSPEVQTPNSSFSASPPFAKPKSFQIQSLTFCDIPTNGKLHFDFDFFLYYHAIISLCFISRKICDF